MYRQILIVLCVAGCVGAQQSHPTAAERVAAVLRKSDPMHNGNGAAELFAPDTALDAAIQATARSSTAERVVRQRALRLARLLELAQRVKVASEPRSIGWWLALDEIDRELPEALRLPLLARTGLDAAALAAARGELAAGGEAARSFCLDWNETRWVTPMDAAHRAENDRYDELEAALKKAGLAATPALFEVLTVPPEGTFSQLDEKKGISARQQVRSILALAAILHLRPAVPYFVMHCAGTSLTQSADASTAVQAMTGEDFGAATLTPGDDAALLKWWTAHRDAHGIVLDHLLCHVVRRAEQDLDSGDVARAESARFAVKRLGRVLGNATELARDAGAEVMHARLEELESDWLRGRDAPASNPPKK